MPSGPAPVSILPRTARLSSSIESTHFSAGSATNAKCPRGSIKSPTGPERAPAPSRVAPTAFLAGARAIGCDGEPVRALGAGAHHAHDVAPADIDLEHGTARLARDEHRAAPIEIRDPRRPLVRSDVDRVRHATQHEVVHVERMS